MTYSCSGGCGVVWQQITEVVVLCFVNDTVCHCSASTTVKTCHTRTELSQELPYITYVTTVKTCHTRTELSRELPYITSVTTVKTCHTCTESSRELPYIKKIKRRSRVALSGISVFDARKVCTDIVKKSWQGKWDEDDKGRSTYEFIPVVGTKVLWPRKHDIGISYARMLLHDTMLKDDSYRTGTGESLCVSVGGQRICTSYAFAWQQICWSHVGVGRFSWRHYIQMQSQIVLVWIKLLSWLLHRAVVTSLGKATSSLKMLCSSLSPEAAWHCDVTNIRELMFLYQCSSLEGSFAATLHGVSSIRNEEEKLKLLNSWNA